MPIASREQIVRRSRFLNEGIRRSASILSGTSDLFLSHSRSDIGPLLDGAIEILDDHGASVYADVLDPEAKQLPPGRFGAFFSQAIEDTERLVALVTGQTATSRWVPWELGLAHGIHSLNRVAIWPVKEREETVSWPRQEYFAMYPRIETVFIDGAMQWCVRDPEDGEYWRLSDWLSLEEGFVLIE